MRCKQPFKLQTDRPLYKYLKLTQNNSYLVHQVSAFRRIYMPDVSENKKQESTLNYVQYQFSFEIN